MILVMGHIKLGAGEGARAKDLLTAHMATTLAEDGCEHYNFAYDAGDPDLVRIQERWRDEAAMAAHGGADHQRAFGRSLRDHGVQQVSVKAWTGEFWRTLIGD